MSVSTLPWPPVEEAAAIAFEALPGESMDPGPRSPEFPAATVDTTPAAAAAFSARARMSRLGSMSLSPSDRLMTFIPSRTAASMPAAISGEFPSSPNPEVGIVSTL